VRFQSDTCRPQKPQPSFGIGACLRVIVTTSILMGEENRMGITLAYPPFASSHPDQKVG
jgi:hypothetical protein